MDYEDRARVAKSFAIATRLHDRGVRAAEAARFTAAQRASAAEAAGQTEPSEATWKHVVHTLRGLQTAPPPDPFSGLPGGTA